MRIGFIKSKSNQNGNLLFQYLCTITGTLSIFTSSMHYGWPTPSLPRLLSNQSHIPMTDSEGSWIAVLMLLGCPLGSMIACLTVDWLGRKKVILMTAFPLIAAWIMIAYAVKVEVIYVARLIAGIADGVIFTTVPMYLGEIADPSIRGLLGSSCSVIMMLGILLINILEMFFDITLSALISITVPILFLMTFSWMPETPYFLLMKGRDDLAKKSLSILKGTAEIDNDMNRLIKTVKCGNFEKGKFLDLFKVRSNRRATIIIVGLRTIQQLSGITAITFYAQIIFENVGGHLSANVTTLIYFSIQCVAIATSAILLDKAGRKPLLITSLIGCAISLVTQAAYYHFYHQNELPQFTFIPVASLVLFIITYCLGLGTIPVLMLGELFPTDVKAFALCLAEIYYGIIATTASKFFQIMKDEFGLYIPFYAFAACCLLGLGFVIYCMPETKGRTLEEIQEYLKDEKKEQPEKFHEGYV